MAAWGEKDFSVFFREGMKKGAEHASGHRLNRLTT
jgi:hypothetical protein